MPACRLISLVPLAMEAYQITLLELQGEKDIGGRCRGEEEVSDGHRRCRPEGEEKAEHDRMTDPAIEEGGLELDRRVRLAGKGEEDLPQSEQVEVIDQKRREKHDGPSGPEDREQEPPANRIGHFPHDVRDGPPLPEEEAEEEATHEDIGAPLDCGRDDSRPPSLEPLAGP